MDRLHVANDPACLDAHRLLAVAQRLGGVRMDVEFNPVGASRDEAVGHALNQPPVA